MFLLCLGSCHAEIAAKPIARPGPPGPTNAERRRIVNEPMARASSRRHPQMTEAIRGRRTEFPLRTLPVPPPGPGCEAESGDEDQAEVDEQPADYPQRHHGDDQCDDEALDHAVTAFAVASIRSARNDTPCLSPTSQVDAMSDVTLTGV